jgi:N-acyl-D-amino-acid deacylase
VPQFDAADTWMREFVQQNDVPGGALAIAVDGQLRFARGYGYADRDARTLVEPDSLFRIASVSKPITAVAVLKLVEEGKLKLEDKIVDVLGLRTPPDYDPWWDQVTIAHLLTHTGGWDRNRSGDPMFMDDEITSAFSAELPVTHQQVIDFQFLRGLDFAPGERYRYSNFGYCLLGRGIEKVTGQPYDMYVKQHLFAPLGITRATIGGSLASQRCEGEVCYYTIDNYEDSASVGPNIGKEKVPGQYGGWQQELLDSHGGWIMSTVDLVKFGAALEEVEGGRSTRGKLVTPQTVRGMFTPQVALNDVAESRLPGYGYGWVVGRNDEVPIVSHGGALPCTAATLTRMGDRVWFAALFNLGRTSDGKWLGSGLDQQLAKAVGEGLQSRSSTSP